MNWPFIIIGSCLELLGWTTAIDVHAGLPWCDPNFPTACTTTILGLPEALPESPDQCWLPAPIADSWFDPYWCQTVAVGNLQIETPCGADFVAKENAPCEYRAYWRSLECPEMFQEMGICVPDPIICP